MLLLSEVVLGYYGENPIGFNYDEVNVNKLTVFAFLILLEASL